MRLVGIELEDGVQELLLLVDAVYLDPAHHVEDVDWSLRFGVLHLGLDEGRDVHIHQEIAQSPVL